MDNTTKSTLNLYSPPMVTPSANGSSIPLVPKKFGFGVRNVQAILIFLCFFTAYILRFNLSFAIVAMTKQNGSNPEFEEFDWDTSTRGQILSSFFWGYLVIQVPAGLMGQSISPKTLLIVTNTLCSLLTLLIPAVARHGGWMALCVLRVLQGLCQGFYVPITYTLASKWCPVNEQNRFIGFTLNGGTLGATVVMPVSGFLASSSGGWPSIFYVTGAFGLLWVLLWVFQGSDSPAKHSKISQAEKEYIQTSLQNNSDESIPVPWASIFTSPAMLAFIAAHIGCGWVFSIVFTQMPSYINSVLGYDMQANGLISAIPYLTMWFISYPVFWVADIMNERQIMSTTHLRKMWATISGTVAALTLICICFVGRNAVAAILLLVIAVSLSSCAFSGVYVNPLDLAPNFAGVLTGIGNGLENISSIFAPLTVGWIVTDLTSLQQWTMAFLLAVVVDIAGNIIFLLWGSAELQPWNEPNFKSKRNVEASSNPLPQSPPPYALS